MNFALICFFHLICQIYWHKFAYNIPLLAFHICRICSDAPSLIPEIPNICFLSLFPDQSR